MASNLLPRADVEKLGYKKLKDYFKGNGLDIPRHATKNFLLQTAIRNGKYQEYVPVAGEKLTALSPRAFGKLDKEGITNRAQPSVSELRAKFNRMGTDSVMKHQYKRSTNHKQQEAVTSLEILKGISLFAGWSKSKLRSLQNKLKDVDFEAGQTLMNAGDPGKCMYIILDGECDVLSPKGEHWASLKEGDYVGEVALLKKCTRNASVRAKTDMCCLSCDKKTFDKLIKSNAKFKERRAKRKAVAVKGMKHKKHMKAPVLERLKSEDNRKFIHDVVGGLRFFNYFGKDQQKMLCNSMVHKNIPSGTKVIKQGSKKSDKFYLVERGCFDILVDGNKVAEKPAGTAFGEIGLLYDKARTADCVANADSSVWVLDRVQFHMALTSHAKQTNKKNIEFLKSVDHELFRHLSMHEFALLQEALREVTYETDSCVIKQGDDPEKFYIIKEGSVIWQVSTDGNMQEGEIQAGAIFGELALVNDDKRAASIITAEKTLLLELSKAEFEELLGNYKEIISREAEELYVKPEIIKRDVEVCELEELVELGVLGKGAFGLVTLVKDPNKSETYALKAIKKQKVMETGMIEYILGEKEIMQCMSCQFLVNLLTTYQDPQKIYFLLEVCLGGEMFTLLRQEVCFEEDAAMFYLACVIEAFDYMHSRNIIYRDLKPENLVFDNQGYLKVADFGFAKVLDQEKTFTFCGTPDYLAPEVIKQTGHAKGVDWWTCGVLLFEMLSSYCPFTDENGAMETTKNIVEKHIKFPRFLSPEAKSIILGLLRKEPHRRLGVIKGGAANVRKQQFFKKAEFDWDKLRARELQAPFPPSLKSNEDLGNFGEASDSESSSEYSDEEESSYSDGEFEGF